MTIANTARRPGLMGSGRARARLAAPLRLPASERLVLKMFQEAAASVPAYRKILRDHRINPANIRTIADFRRHVPVINKSDTFGRFRVEELCRGGEIAQAIGLLTSSGQSSRFAFGLYDLAFATQEVERVDQALVKFFHVDKKRTLLINCLPMGVKVPTRVCTVAETSVRPDMVTALVQQFSPYYDQIILVGDAAFIKLVLEMGQQAGINWPDMLVHAIVGEETLAENARSYLSAILGSDPDSGRGSTIVSSLGVAELGLHLLHETPRLIRLRRVLHADGDLRHRILGTSAPGVPMLFTYDPDSLFAEEPAPFRLVLTPLGRRPVQLIRYDAGDAAHFLDRGQLDLLRQRAGESNDLPDEGPVLLFFGRRSATADQPVAMDALVKEALYHDHALARQVTGNFRLAPPDRPARLRVQLAPGRRPSATTTRRLAEVIHAYVQPPIKVRCQPYEEFGSGMTLNFERKFEYWAQ